MRAQLISELNAAVGQLDIGDLPLLASLHEHFQQIKHDAESAPASASTESMGACAARGKELLERIILQETTDTNAAVASLVETVKSMQALIDGAGASSPAPATPAPERAEAPKESHALAEAPLGTTPDDLSLIGEFVTESREHLDAAEAQLLRLEDQPEDLEAINAVFRSFHTIKGVAGFLNLKQIGALAHASENLLDKARKQEIRLSHDHIDLILRALDLMKRLIGDVESASRAGAALAIRAELPDLIGQVDRAASGEFTPSSAPRLAPPLAAGDGSQATRLNEEAPSEKTTEKSPETPAQSNHQQETVKVATDRLDSLINMVGELVIAQAMVSQDVGSVANSNPRMARNMSHLGKISRELQEIAMSMRMVPIQGVFQKMTRLARDLGRKFGKDLEFVTVGGETELDRNVVEAIGDPLVHMVRNAIDHGIEPPDVRRSAGKSPVGRVQLRAFHQAGAVVIELKDDGKGLRRDKILKKAIENGLVREGQELSDSEVFKLIFAAGLSTAEKVTDVSGRGVGMDVVRKNVENLRGRIDITSEEGKGSVFTIRLSQVTNLL